MQLTATALLLAAVPAAAARGTDGLRALQTPETLPDINDLINIAFPMWEVDENGNRLEVKPCTVNSCEWNPYYITKRYDGLHPDLGGHPTDIDVGYAYFAGSPFAGQPYPGTRTTVLKTRRMTSRPETAPRLRPSPTQTERATSLPTSPSHPSHGRSGTTSSPLRRCSPTSAASIRSFFFR